MTEFVPTDVPVVDPVNNVNVTECVALSYGRADTPKTVLLTYRVPLVVAAVTYPVVPESVKYAPDDSVQYKRVPTLTLV